MKNKQGFTLVELLAVIALLAVLVAIATPAISSISRKSKEKMYDAKVKEIEAAAVLCAEKKDDGTTCTTVGQLCSGGFLSYEDGTTCQVNPITKSSMDGCIIDVNNNNHGRWTAHLSSSCRTSSQSNNGASLQNVTTNVVTPPQTTPSDDGTTTQNGTSSSNNVYENLSLDEIKEIIKSEAEKCIKNDTSGYSCKSAESLHSNKYIDDDLFTIINSKNIICNVSFDRPPNQPHKMAVKSVRCYVPSGDGTSSQNSSTSSNSGTTSQSSSTSSNSGTTSQSSTSSSNSGTSSQSSTSSSNSGSSSQSHVVVAGDADQLAATIQDGAQSCISDQDPKVGRDTKLCDTVSELKTKGYIDNTTYYVYSAGGFNCQIEFGQIPPIAQQLFKSRVTCSRETPNVPSDQSEMAESVKSAAQSCINNQSAQTGRNPDLCDTVAELSSRGNLSSTVYQKYQNQGYSCVINFVHIQPYAQQLYVPYVTCTK